MVSRLEKASAVKRFRGYVLFACIDNDRNGGGDALIAAARVDDDGHITAAHSCFGSGGGIGFHAGDNAVRIGFADNAPDSETVIPGHSLVGNVHIAANLPFKELADFVNFDLICKHFDCVQRKTGAVGVKPCAGRCARFFENGLAVTQNAHDIRMRVAHLDFNRVAFGGQKQDRG